MPIPDTVELDPTPLFVPPKVGGDAEFEGHGPDVTVSAELSLRNGRELWASVYMHAKETKRDWTEVEGTEEYLVYKRPERRILRILSDTYSIHNYRDTNHEVDIFNMPADELVRSFECIGDTKGKEAGRTTGVRVYFNPVRIEYENEPFSPIILPEIDPISFIPGHVKGDPEFEGHGPKVQVSASISVEKGTEIWARIWMNAKETTADWTEAEGSKHCLIYRHDRPLQIISPLHSDASYEDTDYEDDELFLGETGLVKKFVCTGDIVGHEAGTKTGVVVHFNPIVIRNL